jgi:hypothetical protein
LLYNALYKCLVIIIIIIILDSFDNVPRFVKLNQLELKRRELRILRELGKTYLKILIKIKA